MSAPPVTIPDELIYRLRQARRVAALSGAGVSAESGVPTFREAQTGLWAQYRPDELATVNAFQRNPRLVWEWYAWRRDLVSKAQPNPGHFSLVHMEIVIPVFTLITQNVDGLHQRAGSGVRFEVIELHGNIQRVICFERHHPIHAWQENGEAPPRCPLCGSQLRPDVVWFGESLPAQALQDAWMAAENCEIFLSIGTSSLVEPAASLPYIAQRAGAILVEINPNETPLTRRTDFVIQAPSGEALPALVQAAWPRSTARTVDQPHPE